MDQPKSAVDILAATLREIGLDAVPRFHTILLRDRYFVGYKYYFDGGYAVWILEQGNLAIFDDAGNLLKEVPIAGDGQQVVAA